MKKIIMMMFALMAIMTGAGAQDVYYPQIPVEIEVYSTNLPSLKTIPTIASSVDVQYIRYSPIQDGDDMDEILDTDFSDFPFISVSNVTVSFNGEYYYGSFRLNFSALPANVVSRRFQIVTGDESVITFLQVNTAGIVLSASPSGPLFPNPADARELVLTGGIEGDTYRLYKDGTDTGRTASHVSGSGLSFGTVYEPGIYTVRSAMFGNLPNSLSLQYFNLFIPGNEYLEGLIGDEEVLVSCEGGLVEMDLESEAFCGEEYYTPMFEKMNTLGIPGKWPAGEVPISFERYEDGEEMVIRFNFPCNDSGVDKVYDTGFCFREDGGTLKFRQHPIDTTFSGDNFIGKRTYSSVNAGSYYDDVSYYDGLGYLEQTVSVKAVSSTKSLIQPFVYDAMRHEDATSYLPYSMNKTDASYVSGAVAAQGQWYAAKDARPYSEKTYEPGLSGRPLTFMREGKIYADSSVVIGTSYSINDGTEGVIKFIYADPANASQPATVTPSGSYQGGTLSVVKTVSEDRDTSYVFNDVLGRLVLSRRVNDGINHDTYYVYDRRDSVACVVQPEGSARLTPSSSAFTFDGDFADKWCFTYKYDSWGNITERHVPGGGKKYYIYDARDRVVLSTDSELMSKGWWRYTEYDAINRITEKGLCKLISTATLSEIKEEIASDTDYSDYIYGKIVLHTLTYQDGLVQNQNGFVSVSGVATYNDRDYRHNRFRLASERLYQVPLVSSYIYQPTYYVERKYFYDYRGLPVQIAETASDGWTGRTSMKYDFSGNVLVSVEEHTSPGGKTDRLTLQNTYDNRGRLLTCSANMNGTSLSTQYNYDDLGRLVSKRLNGYDMEDEFSYNLQGWLTGISSGNGGSVEICNKTIKYYDAPGSPRYGGKISYSFTNHYGAASFRSEFGYDNLGRLVSEVKKTGSSGTTPFSEEHYSYDKNGNISSISRREGTDIEANLQTFSRIGNRLNYLFIGEYDEDPEQYTYDMNGAVTYDGNAHCWITGNVLGLQGEMWFEDGSFKENKYLSDGTKTACFHDDCYENGLKYRGSMVYRLEWDEDLRESVERFESAAHPEGRFYAESFTPAGQPVLQSWHYVTDQIGSVLAVVDMDMMAAEDEDAAIERNEFGAYGDRINHASFTKISGNRNRFNGKEELENTPGPYVDYGARIYSTSARQWLCPDPMAEKYPEISPYVFCAGDPVNIVDPDGLSTYVYQNADGTYTVTDKGDVHDGDNGVYIGYEDKDGKWINTGKKIGETVSPYSFYNSDTGNWALGSIIDLTDVSGQDFLTDLYNNTPSLIDYMENARNGEFYDFKVSNGQKEHPENLDHYRGMAIGPGMIASARDIGNIGAGYVSAVKGIPYSFHRAVCDLYQSFSSSRKECVEYINLLPLEWRYEGVSSTSAQQYGWELGKKRR